MKTSKILATASVAFSLLAAAGAQAETYNGVHPLNSARSRAEVQAEAVVAAHSANPYAEGYASGAPVVSANSRAEVNSQAVIAAHSPNPYADGYGSGAPVVTANSRSTVRSEAIAAAHAPNQNLYREAFVGSVIPEQYTVTRPLTLHAAR